MINPVDDGGSEYLYLSAQVIKSIPAE